MNSFHNSENIRICHIIDHLSLHGAQMYLARLVGGLAERGYEQRVYGMNDPRHPKIVRMMEDAGAKVRTIGKARLLSGVGLIQLFLDLIRWNPQIVQTYLPYSDIIGRLLGHMAGVPFNISVVTQPNVDKRRWQYLLDRRTAGLSDRVVFNSNRVIPFALANEGISEGQVVFIANGIDIEPPSHSGIGRVIRDRLGIPADAIVIGCVARLYPQKGHSFLLRAFVQVLEDCPGAVLMLVGDGPLRSELEGQAAEFKIAGSVRFLGDREDLADVLEAMDLYVQSSLWEGMSVALMQAMKREIPVVATAVEGTMEIIEEGKTGFLVHPRDSDALARAIIHAMKNEELAMQVGRNAALMIDRDYSVNKMVSRFDEMCRDLLGRTPRPRGS